MHLDQAHAHLNAAAREVFRRLRRHRERAPRRLRPAFAYLESYIFDLDFTVERWKRACRVRESLDDYLRRELATTPLQFVRACRFETAARLLGSTDLPVSKVSELVGYATGAAFSTGFAKWSGLRPVAYRARMAVHPPSFPHFDEEALRRASLGTLEPAHLRSLIQGLIDLYNTAAPNKIPPNLSPEAPSREGAESPARESLLARVGADVAAPYGAVEVFERLRRMSCEEGRADRHLGVRLAEMALASLYASEERFEATCFQNLLARGWAWLGNALTLAGRLEDAERAFIAGESCLPPRERDPLALGDLCDRKACLCWRLRHLEEGIELANRAVPLMRVAGDSEALARALVVRAILHEHAGRPDLGLPDLEEASSLVDRENDFLVLAVSHNLAKCYACLERFEDAAKLLPIIQQSAAKVEGASLVGFVPWIEGLVRRGLSEFEEAELHLARARKDFLGADDDIHAALVSLDLALVSLKRHDIEEAIQRVERSLPALSALEPSTELLAARAVLEEAVEERAITYASLFLIRRQLARISQGLPSDA